LARQAIAEVVARRGGRGSPLFHQSEWLGLAPAEAGTDSGSVASPAGGAGGGVSGEAPSAGSDGGAAAADRSFLDQPGAAFVTLTQAGELRGCIGSLEAWRPLRQDVRANAVAAAFDDPRFPPLGADELARTAIEVSVLSAPEPIAFTDRADLLRQLRPGVDGLILSAPGHRGTFLPQVWEQLPTPELFLEHLVRKAHLPPGYWSDDVVVQRYTVAAFAEPGA
jgi:AmmeMemoRadiSam system protein A